MPEETEVTDQKEKETELLIHNLGSIITKQTIREGQ